eukprot:4660759-Pleurochrysis_carterae.AAC.3
MHRPLPRAARVGDEQRRGSGARHGVGVGVGLVSGGRAPERRHFVADAAAQQRLYVRAPLLRRRERQRRVRVARHRVRLVVVEAHNGAQLSQRRRDAHVAQHGVGGAGGRRVRGSEGAGDGGRRLAAAALVNARLRVHGVPDDVG